jgi:hypothetical protein
MGIRRFASLSIRPSVVTSLVAIAATLSGCYVVPLDPRTGQPATMQQTPIAPPPPGPVTFPVRLYPANDLASRYGVISAAVTNDLHGKGTFNTNINGEAFVGEATRRTDAARTGVANGAGNRGSYIACTYSMNTTSQGTGQCRLSDGAVFSMHMGN